MRKEFSFLVTGHEDGAPGAQPVAQTYANLKKHIETVLEELQKAESSNEQSFLTLGPFLARSILEISLCAVLGRVDPFRLLVIRQVQSQPEYDLGQRVLSAIQWTGDIIPKEKCTNPWSADREYSKIPRSLLSEPYEQIYWVNALERLNDDEYDGRGGAWLASIRTIPPESFIPRMRGDLIKLYSSLSKGVHQEMLIPPERVYSRKIVRDLYEDVVRAASIFALLLSFSEHSYGRIPPLRAIELLEKIQEDLKDA